jgi:hypothetical protein
MQGRAVVIHAATVRTERGGRHTGVHSTGSTAFMSCGCCMHGSVQLRAQLSACIHMR